MIRFVDLSRVYWTEPEDFGIPCCAFLDTVDDTFIESSHGGCVFDGISDILEAEASTSVISRMISLVPAGYFGDGRQEGDD